MPVSLFCDTCDNRQGEVIDISTLLVQRMGGGRFLLRFFHGPPWKEKWLEITADQSLPLAKMILEDFEET